ncbi:MAG: putative DNA modification/repair radical SAM protein [Pseudomonas fluorescens]|nr:MAG: putative DNA modification/repair radical SAM protein [Pseudomonas fluorescens]
METAAKLAILSDAAKYDASCASGGGKGDGLRKTQDGGIGNTRTSGICHSYTPDGRCVSLLKILMTNFCIFDCKYCVNRVSSDTPRARFSVSEVVNLTLDFYRRNYIEGLFLSSGIIRNSDYTMEQLVAVAKSLRQEHGFGGYIHLKTIPGASNDLLAEAGLYADRLSVNIELPTPADISQLAPEKNHTMLENNMRRIRIETEENRDARKTFKTAPVYAPGGQSTQMIVGATPTADRAILQTAHHMYQTYGMRRVYYSAFSPIPHADNRLPLVAPPLVREHRLYQSDWLLRFYGYTVDEVVPPDTPDLDLGVDPKVAWALRNPQFFPLDINKASKRELLRVPGFGVQGVKRILAARRFQTLRLIDLVQMRIGLLKATPFIITADKNPDTKILDAQDFVQKVRSRLIVPQQMSLVL